MKKLLIATLLIVLATLTETPDDRVITGSGTTAQVDAYLSAWAQAEDQGFIAEGYDSAEPCSDVLLDQFEFDGDAILSI